MSAPVHCPPSGCSSCRYRRDTPPGIWAPEEYLKLPEYDDGGTALVPFHCHQELATDVPTLCRGWVSCHGFASVAVRIAVATGLVTVEQVKAPCAVPLYSSGREACDAGMRGVRRPGKKARKAIDRLAKRFERQRRVSGAVSYAIDRMAEEREDPS